MGRLDWLASIIPQVAEINTLLPVDLSEKHLLYHEVTAFVKFRLYLLKHYLSLSYIFSTQMKYTHWKGVSE
jgi:hypothetical protein